MSQYNFVMENIVVTAGQDNWVVLRVPPRGQIKTLTVVQVTGDVAGFDFDVFNNRRAMDEAVSESSSSSGAPAPDPSLSRIFDTKSTVSDLFQEFDQSYDYRNRDGSPSNLQRRLYMRLRPTGAGSKEFQMSMLIDLPTLL